MQNSRGQRKKGGKEESRTGFTPGGWRNWSRGQIHTSGQLFRVEVKHLRLLRVKQLVCRSLNGMIITQTTLAAAIYTPDRDRSPLESAATGSWSTELGEQSQGKLCCWLQGDSPRGLWEEMQWEMFVKESQANMESGWYCWVTRRRQSHLHSLSLPTHHHWTAGTLSRDRDKDPREIGPASAWCTKQQRRTPARVAL